MKQLQKILEQCKAEFGSRLIYYNQEENKDGLTLHMQFDGSSEDSDTAFYPSIEKGTLTVYESLSNVLNVYVHSGNKMHFYYEGSMATDTKGNKYAEPSDPDGSPYDADSVFKLHFDEIKEIPEWIHFILSFKDGNLKRREISYSFSEKPASYWFDGLFVLVPEFSKNMLSFETSQPLFDIYTMPKLHDEAYGIGDLNFDEYQDKLDVFSWKRNEINSAGQLELLRRKEKFLAALDQESFVLAENDILLLIGGNGNIISFEQYTGNSSLSSFYYLVLRPSKNVSSTAIHHYLFFLREGRDMIQEMSKQRTGLPAFISFIPEILDQQLYVLEKKTALDKLHMLVEWMYEYPRPANESLENIKKSIEEVSKFSLVNFD